MTLQLSSRRSFFGPFVICSGGRGQEQALTSLTYSLTNSTLSHRNLGCVETLLIWQTFGLDIV